MATSRWSRNSVATTCARAIPAVGFKNCCMQSGEFDGSDRDYFFQGVIPCVSRERWYDYLWRKSLASIMAL